MKRILVCDPMDEGALAQLRQHPGIELSYEPTIEPEALDARIGEFHAVLVRSRTKLRRPTLERAHNLQAIGRAGTGLDNIDVAFAESRGIAVRNAPGVNANAVAELALALMLMLARRVPAALETVRQGAPKKVKGIELAGKTLGLIGFGNIGRRVARLAQGFRMEVVAHDPLVQLDQVPEALRVVPLCGLDELLARSDFVSLHVPLSDETRDTIDAAALSRVKPGAYLINTARGGLVDERAAAAALDSGQLSGLATDFFAPDSPLLGHDRAILTPHIGASSQEAQERAGEETVGRVLEALGI